MAEKHHITQINKTEAQLEATLDPYQIGIGTQAGENFCFMRGTTFRKTASQLYNSNGGNNIFNHTIYYRTSENEVNPIHLAVSGPVTGKIYMQNTFGTQTPFASENAIIVDQNFGAQGKIGSTTGYYLKPPTDEDVNVFVVDVTGTPKCYWDEDGGTGPDGEFVIDSMRINAQGGTGVGNQRNLILGYGTGNIWKSIRMEGNPATNYGEIGVGDTSGNIRITSAAHTSGGTVILEDNMFTSNGTFSGIVDITSGSVTSPLPLVSDDDTATENPVFQVYRNSPSPADNDVIGSIHFDGNDNQVTPAQTTYAKFTAVMEDVSDGNEEGRLELHIMNGGSLDKIFQFDESGIEIEGSSANQIRLTYNDAGAAAGPNIIMDRNSASPAVNDDVGTLNFLGKDSGANQVTYGQFNVEIVDPTDTSEDSRFRWVAMTAGSPNLAMYLEGDGGLYVDADVGTGDDPVALFDDYNDPMEIQRIVQQVDYKRGEELGIFKKVATTKINGKEVKSGYYFNMQKFSYLLAGGIYQMNSMMKQMQDRISFLENKLLTA